eukprot:7591102-Pyramimonas_sp.AAC.1
MASLPPLSARGRWLTAENSGAVAGRRLQLVGLDPGAHHLGELGTLSCVEGRRPNDVQDARSFREGERSR